MSNPGAYVSDATEGITDPKDLPAAEVICRALDDDRHPCPKCSQSCGRHDRRQRRLHDLGNLRSRRPRDILLTFSTYQCESCGFFCADMSKLASPGSHYTQRVVNLAVQLVVEDALSYRAAAWHLWRDFRVFVPFATIQNWVEAAGEKMCAGSGV